MFTSTTHDLTNCTMPVTRWRTTKVFEAFLMLLLVADRENLFWIRRIEFSHLSSHQKASERKCLRYQIKKEPPTFRRTYLEWRNILVKIRQNSLTMLNWESEVIYSLTSCNHGVVWLVNKPFARSGHMARNKLHWDANYAVGLLKQRKVGLDWYEFPCFGSPTA